MRERLQHTHKSEIRQPQLGNVEIGSGVDFVYIMKKDAEFTMNPIAEKMATDLGIEEEALRGKLIEAYDSYFLQLTQFMIWGFSHRGNTEFHIFHHDELEIKAREKSTGTPLISLDPQIYSNVEKFEVSRAYYPGGVNEFGQVSRPGTIPLDQQAELIAASLSGQQVNVTEDDIFSGGSAVSALEKLVASGVAIKDVIPEIQIGDAEKIKEMGIGITPIVKYSTEDGSDIFDKVDLGDPRDFLIGASGLVIKMPNGEFGRAPYILPFVSASARASIPKSKEQEFSHKVLQISSQFFQNIEQKTGKPVLLKYMDQFFVRYMKEMYGVESDIPMTQVIALASVEFDELWKFNQEVGFISAIEDLGLPSSLVFLDVNGTLIPDDSDGTIDHESLTVFKQVTSELKQKGFEIGLCSDSPLPQLKEFSQKLGLTGPIIAENGNIISYSGKEIKINELPDIKSVKGEIQDLAKGLGYQEVDEVVAAEFGGNNIDFSQKQWGFGANRTTSISVFGPGNLITLLGKTFADSEHTTTDSAPEYNYFAIHPNDLKTNKGNTLSFFRKSRHSVFMVGNSSSDWVDPELGIQCAFVANAKISPETAIDSFAVSNKTYINGVNSLLQKICRSSTTV